MERTTNIHEAARGSYSTPLTTGAYTGKRKIRHIGVGSAASVLAVFYMVIWGVTGLLFGLLGGAAIGMMANAMSGYSYGYGSSSGSAINGLLLVYFLGFVVAAAGGLITGAVYACVYNVAARFTGGLEVDIA